MTLMTRASIWAFILCLAESVLAQNETSGEVSIPVRIDLSGQSLISNTELSITCKDCTVHGDISLSGGSADSLPDSNFSSLPFDYTYDWAGAVVEDFDVHMEFDFILTPTNATNEVTIPLLFTNGITYSQNFGIFAIDWTFDPVIHGWVNSSKTANFSYGFDFTIPANSAVFIPVFHLENITTIGFANSSITPLNYTSSDPSDDFTFELSFRPIFKVSLDVVTIDTGLYAEIFADVPKLDIAVIQVQNVTRDCQPAPAGTASDQVFSDLTYVVPTLGFDWGFNATAIDTIEFPIGDNVSLPTSCLDYSEKTHALGAVPDKSNNGYIMGPRVFAMGYALVTVLLCNFFWL